MTLKLLHITPHLGCGVGRVLSQVAGYHATHQTGVEERFISLERAQKMQFVDAITAVGAPVLFDVNAEELKAQLAWADIIQLEWWHHPAMAQWLHANNGFSGRLAIWSHTSGLHYPSFPSGLARLPHVFMATTAASPAGVAVPSSGGFDDIPVRENHHTGAPRYGYLGSLGSAKLHPHIMDFVDAAPESFRLAVYGDDEPSSPLMPSPRVAPMGYTNQPATALAQMDVLVYLLNPLHYGTTENALLEAMAAGVVPIVMNNAVESAIVKHGITGMVVDSPASFAEALAYLESQPEARIRMAQAASADIRARFSLAATVQALRTQYQMIASQPVRSFDFSAVYGDSPFAWFVAGFGRYAPLFADGAEESKRAARLALPFLYEPNKSSVFHYQRYFPEDASLTHWAKVLEGEHAHR
jgi:glycosyltransferase involved in cell wall biosynthesis